MNNDVQNNGLLEEEAKVTENKEVIPVHRGVNGTTLEVESAEDVDSTKKDFKHKLRVSDYVGYLIYGIELLYSIFVQYSNFSFDSNIVVSETGEFVRFAFKLICYKSACALFWIALYGLVATFLRKKFPDFYKWFTIFSILLFVVSLSIFII